MFSNLTKKKLLRYFMAKKMYSTLPHSVIVYVIICTFWGDGKYIPKFDGKFRGKRKFFWQQRHEREDIIERDFKRSEGTNFY
jgi:hypothetical protein